MPSSCARAPSESGPTRSECPPWPSRQTGRRRFVVRWLPSGRLWRNVRSRSPDRSLIARAEIELEIEHQAVVAPVETSVEPLVLDGAEVHRDAVVGEPYGHSLPESV